MNVTVLPIVVESFATKNLVLTGGNKNLKGWRYEIVLLLEVARIWSRDLA